MSLYRKNILQAFLGAREMEPLEFEDEGLGKGSRENGGFWWALNGPVIIDVSQFDRNEENGF